MDAKTVRRLTLNILNERVVSVGVVSPGNGLHGLGYVYEGGREWEWEGEMQSGQLHGEGVKRELATGRAIYGRFNKGDIRSLDVLTDRAEVIKESLCRLKKRVHIHSLEYRNDYMN